MEVIFLKRIWEMENEKEDRDMDRKGRSEIKYAISLNVYSMKAISVSERSKRKKKTDRGTETERV